MIRHDLISRFSEAATLDETPSPIDVRTSTPPNPLQQVQLQFVGLSYSDAYAEAETFIRNVEVITRKYAKKGLGESDRLVDFGSGWGRITRFLLGHLPATAIYALDVDPQMTALVNTTLPGVNAMTTQPLPPTVLADASQDGLVAFSVFSHLAPHAQTLWAKEFARIVRKGGFVAFTVLERNFLEVMDAAQRAVADGTANDFQTSMAPTFDDIAAALAGFDHGIPQYAPSGGGGDRDVRAAELYGWTATPRSHVERTWTAAGFQLVSWVPTDELFPQALVVLVRQPKWKRPIIVGKRCLRSAQHDLSLIARRLLRSANRRLRSARPSRHT